MKSFKKTFKFLFPLTGRTYYSNISRQPVTPHVGDLEIEYEGEFRPDVFDDPDLVYSAGIRTVKDVNGNDITEMMRSTQFEDVFRQIYDAAQNNVEHAFTQYFKDKKEDEDQVRFEETYGNSSL